MKQSKKIMTDISKSIDEYTLRKIFSTGSNIKTVAEYISKHINKPIPTDTATLSVLGIALNIASRTFVTESTIKTRPSTNTAVKACCQLYPIPNTTVYAKYALRPRPGARIKG